MALLPSETSDKYILFSSLYPVSSKSSDCLFLIETIFRNGSNTWRVLGAIIILSLKSISNVSEEIGIFALKMQRIN